MMIDTLPVARTDATHSAIGRSGEARTARIFKNEKNVKQCKRMVHDAAGRLGTCVIARGIQLIKVLLYVTAKNG